MEIEVTVVNLCITSNIQLNVSVHMQFSKPDLVFAQIFINLIFKQKKKRFFKL